MTPKIFPLGDAAAVIEFAADISPQTRARITAFTKRLATDTPRGIVEWVPAYTSVTVFYDPLLLPEHSRGALRITGVSVDDVAIDLYSSGHFERLKEDLRPLLSDLECEEFSPPRTIELPVCYGGEYGADLEFVANHHGITPAEVIKLHVEGEYIVHTIGFAPGFPYLGGMSPSLATPRLSSPRTHVPAGSVGIGGAQTGVYSIPSPGGWRLIGRTPVELFRFDRTEPSLLRAGDRVRFRRITSEEFARAREVADAAV